MSNMDSTIDRPPQARGYYSEPMPNPEMFDDTIDLKEVFITLWQKKLFIAATSLLGLIVSVAVALMQPVYYQADTLLIPSKTSESTSNSLAKYSALASLAGVSMGGNSESKQDIALQLLKTRQFISEFLTKREIMPQVIAAKGWDKSNDTIKLDPELYDESSGRWALGKNKDRSPSPELLSKSFNALVQAEASKKDGGVTVKVKHYSPAFAKQLSDWLVEDLNREMRDIDVARADEMIVLLEDKLATTAISENKQLMYKMLDEQNRKKLMASGQKDYVFQVLDPAVVPENPLSKKRLIVLLGFTLSFMASCLGVLLYTSFVANKD